MDRTKRPLQEALAHLSPTAVMTLISALEDKKAEDITLIPLPESAIADAFVVVTGVSDRHVGTLADEAVKALHKLGLEVLSLEGCPLNKWVVVDAGEIIVHIFQEEMRDFYNLEKMWSHHFDQEDDDFAFADFSVRI